MKHSVSLLFVVCLIFGFHSVATTANPRNSSSEDTRTVFLKTRNSSSKTSPSGPADKAKIEPRVPIGLGVTLFQKNGEGKPVRVDPDQTFRTGDSVRFKLEPNTDGFLYIFHTENRGQPKMLFPDVRLNNGDNSIKAHVPVEIPSSKEVEEKHRWFDFKGNRGIERLYIVVTREPLPKVPTGIGLKDYCSPFLDTDTACVWNPGPQLWKTLTSQVNKGVRQKSDNKTFGQEETEEEYLATNRDFGLSSDAPPPAQVKMAVSVNAKRMVVLALLSHQ